MKINVLVQRSVGLSPSIVFTNVKVLHHLYTCPLEHKSDINNNYKFRLDLTEDTLHLHHKHQLVNAAYDDKSLAATCPTPCGQMQCY